MKRKRSVNHLALVVVHPVRVPFVWKKATKVSNVHRVKIPNP